MRQKNLKQFCKIRLGRVQVLLGVAVLSAFVAFPLPTSAADFAQRRLYINSSVAGEVTSHTFSMNTSTAGTIGSFVFQYCANNPFYGTACTAPAGLNVLPSTLATQTGITGFTKNNGITTANRLVISRPAGATAPQPVSYAFDTVTNPTTINQTVYVRVSSHASTDGTGLALDTGAFVFSTAEGVSIGGYVPPYLTFCVGITVGFNCVGGGGVLNSFGEFSANSTSSLTTQFGVATNDPTGYNTFMNGQTLTSGNIQIQPLNTNSTSQTGVSQFGLNVVGNTNPSVGANVSGTGFGTPANGYNTPNSFRFVEGERVAFSTRPTRFTTFTVSYIANIPASQKPGVYSSTLTYTAVASF